MNSYSADDILTLECEDRACKTCLFGHVGGKFNERGGKLLLKDFTCIYGDLCKNP